jgi:hypothetical protein
MELRLCIEEASEFLSEMETEGVSLNAATYVLTPMGFAVLDR